MYAEDSLRIATYFPVVRTILHVLSVVLLLSGVGLRICGQNKTNEVSPMLEPHLPLESEINGGESQTYSFRLDSDRYVHMIVQQEGIDVDVIIYGPNGYKQAEVDRPNGTYGPEAISLIAKQEGVYRLQIHSFERSAARGRVRIMLDMPRAPQPQDEQRIRAEATAAEAERQRNVATADALARAIKGFQVAITDWKQLDDQYEIAVASYGLGWSHSVLCEYDDAITHFEDAARIMKDLHDEHGRAFSLTGLAYAYLYLGENKKALENFQTALDLRRQTNNIRGQAMALYGIASVQSVVGEEEKALGNYFESLPLRQHVGDKVGEAVTYSGIGKTFRRMGRYQEALYHLQQALTILRESHNRAGEADTLSNIGWVYFSLQQYDRALNCFIEALPITQQVGDPGGQAMTLYGMARVESHQNQLLAARDHIKTALDILESLRTKISNEQLRASYFASVQDYYEFYIDVLMQLHETLPEKGFEATALGLSERARARNLLDLLSEAHANIRQGVDLSLLTKERLLQRQINSKMDYRLRLQNAATPQESQIVAVDREISDLQLQSDELGKQIRQVSPRYASLQHPEPSDVFDIQKRVIDQDTVLLEYALGSSNCYIWIVTSNSLHGEKLPHSSEEIRRTASNLIHMITTAGGTISSYESMASDLSKMLLPKAAITQLKQKRNVLIVANGVLQSFPFNMLSVASDSYSPLVADHVLVSLPSASTIAALRTDQTVKPRHQQNSIMVFADPVFAENDERVTNRRVSGATRKIMDDSAAPAESNTRIAEILSTGDMQTRAGVRLVRLPGTRREAKMIKRLIPGAKIALDFNANLNAVNTPDIAKYKIVHFATHGIAPDDHPEFAGVVLSLVTRRGEPQEGYLGLPFVYNLNLPADLVVLSACETGLGEDVRGEGLVGLTRGFMYAGSSRVIASLWKVREGATEEVMKRFYHAMVKEGLPPSTALSKAEGSMWAEHKWAPADWAGFVFFGDWR